MATSCLTDETLSDFLAGALSAPERRLAERHLADCANCSALLAFVQRTRQPEQSTDPMLPRALGPGAVVDRFIVLGAAGAGAMGAVHIAHDPTLDRKVALKVLHGEADSEHARSRLRREAQALAKLSSRHLVAVFDALRWHGQLVVAMEYVEGTNLQLWLRERRGWKEVVQVFLQAGRGLADLHAAGLVHRDFKPANVLIATDGAPGAVGRVKVADLGLVSAIGAVSEPNPDTSVTSELLTHPGAILGTPAYMSPEQLRGEPASPLSDQFSFCVALFEGLEGKRPFDAKPVRELVAQRGVRPVPPLTRPVPAWLRRLVRRGLEADPAARFASMKELLDELSRDRQVRRARRLLGATAVLSFAALAALTALRRPPNPCVEEALAREWTPAVRARLGGAGLRAGELAELERRLDVYVRQWDDNIERQCHGEEVGGGPAPPHLVPFFACLTGRRREFHDLLTGFSRGDVELVALGAELVALLPPASTCVTPRGMPPRRDQLPLVSQEPRLRLLEARQGVAAGELEVARAQLEATLAACQQTDGHVEAQALLLQARLEDALGRPFFAEDSARRALIASFRQPRDTQGVVEAWWQLALFAAREPGPAPERQRAVSWLASLASAELGTLPTDAVLLQTLGDAVAAELALLHAEPNAAVVAATRALSTAETLAPPDPLVVTDARLRLARARRASGQLDDARALLERTLTERLTDFQRREGLELLADVLDAQGRDPEAAARREEAARLARPGGPSTRPPR